MRPKAGIQLAYTHSKRRPKFGRMSEVRLRYKVPEGENQDECTLELGLIHPPVVWNCSDGEMYHEMSSA